MQEDLKNWMTDKEAAKKLKVVPGTLRNWRYLKKPEPRFEKIGYGVYYHVDVIKAFRKVYLKSRRST